MPEKLQLKGKVFGRLTVIEEDGRLNGCVAWSCLCSCGNSVTVRGNYIASGKTKSCGCLQKEVTIKRNIEAGEYPRANPKELRQYRLKMAAIGHKFKISEDEFRELQDKCKGYCPVCHRDFSKVRQVVDHCHNTGEVRGMLCFECNSGLGLLGDTMRRASRLVTYLSCGD